MSDKLTAEPGSPEFLKQLLKLAESSDHPMDKALAKVLKQKLEEEAANEQSELL